MNIFVFDLDDTLLDRDKRVGLDTKRELMNRSDQGDAIVFASSRPIRAIRQFIEDNLLATATIISLNGAVRHSLNGTTKRYSAIGDRVGNLINDLKTVHNIHFSIELLGEEFATNATYTTEELMTEQSATPDMTRAINEIKFSEISKIALDGLGQNIMFLIPQLERIGLYPIPCNDGTFLNVVDPNVDKSITLERTVLSLGHVDPDIYVFGDDIPDIRMMKFATRSIAMKNARHEVKKIADDIIGDCDDDSIGAYIRNVISQ